jgi:hypothetical protein
VFVAVEGAAVRGGLVDVVVAVMVTVAGWVLEMDGRVAALLSESAEQLDTAAITIAMTTARRTERMAITF